MKIELLQKANNLKEDIDNIEVVLSNSKSHKWIKPIFFKKKGLSVIGASHDKLYYSVRFQKELAEWLEQKLKEYQKEFDELI